MAETTIEVKNLTKFYGDFQALKGISFEVHQGEIVGFLGPNGAGKSTTMKILTCFIAPSEGTAKINGHDIWENPLGVRASIGYLPESTPLYPEMLVAEYLEFMGQMRGLKGAELGKRIKKVVDETSLGEVYAKEIRALSKGYKQRVGLAQALIHEPPILILDEPMSGLDPNQAQEIRDLISDIGKSRTVLLSTHNLSEVQVTCQRVLIVSKGKLVADDTPSALTGRGRKRYVVTVTGDRGASAKDVAAKVRDAFGKLGDVDTVRETSAKGSEVTVEITAASGGDLRADIFRAALAAGAVLLELRTVGANLEQVFRDLTVAPAAAAAADDEDDDSSAADDEEDE
jgi:ABC-2 type transport system ATP-binding protein